jgi:hypothetical protein
LYAQYNKLVYSSSTNTGTSDFGFSKLPLPNTLDRLLVAVLLKEVSKSIPMIVEATENPERPVPEYLNVDLKAKKEELWLKNKFSDYHSYQLQVNKFIPWIY